jgi:hypothetical protein
MDFWRERERKDICALYGASNLAHNSQPRMGFLLKIHKGKTVLYFYFQGF